MAGKIGSSTNAAGAVPIDSRLDIVTAVAQAIERDDSRRGAALPLGR
jgi:hypothetical protein